MYVGNTALDNDDLEVADDIDPKLVSEEAIVLEMQQHLDMFVDRKEEVPDEFLVLLAELIERVVVRDVRVALVVPSALNVLIDYDYVELVVQFDQAVLEGHVN